jgi:hypothetical protein
VTAAWRRSRAARAYEPVTVTLAVRRDRARGARHGQAGHGQADGDQGTVEVWDGGALQHHNYIAERQRSVNICDLTPVIR